MREPSLVGWLALALAACSVAPKPAAPPASADAPPPLALQIVRTAWAYLPEEDGGRPVPTGDAAFVRQVFAENAVDVPGDIGPLTLAGVRVSSAALRPADVLIFSGRPDNRIAAHAGLYAGNGSFLHFRDGFGVTLERLDTSYHRARFITARRFIP